MKSRAALLLVALFASGCAYHVQLSAPPPTAPVAEREAAYVRLRPTRLAETHVTFFDRLFARNQQFVDYLELADGTRVAMPEDILPVVRPDSVAALAVMDSLDARRTRRVLRITAPLLKIAGAATMILGFQSDDLATRRALLIGGGVAIGGGIALRIGSHYVRQREEDAARRAFVSFGVGLRDFLQVCPEGDQHGVCAPPPAQSGWERAPGASQGWQQAPSTPSDWERAP